jgi:hypothetical protein
VEKREIGNEIKMFFKFEQFPPDPITPGRRRGPPICDETGDWALAATTLQTRAARYVLFLMCKSSKLILVSVL